MTAPAATSTGTGSISSPPMPPASDLDDISLNRRVPPDAASEGLFGSWALDCTLPKRPSRRFDIL